MAFSGRARLLSYVIAFGIALAWKTLGLPP